MAKPMHYSELDPNNPFRQMLEPRSGGGLLGGVSKLHPGNAIPKNPFDRGGEYKGIDQNNFNVPKFDDQWGAYNYALKRQHQAPQAQANQAAYARAQGAQAQGSAARQQQSQVGRMLMREARGNGPAQRMAQLNAQNMADRGVAQQMAMAASGRPGMGVMAGRAAAMNAADINSRVGEQAMMGGLAAQMNAQQMAGQHFAGMRGQDQDMSQFNAAARNNMRQFNAANRNQMNQFNAGSLNDMNQFNANAQLQTMGLNDRRQLDLLGQRLRLAEMQQQGMMGYEGNRTQRYGYAMGTPTGTERFLGMAGGLAKMAMMPGKPPVG